MIRGKRAWLKIVEAFLACMIIAAAILIILERQTSPPSIDENVYERQTQILDFISKNESLREKIILNDSDEVNAIISKMIPGNWNFTTNICNLEDICSANVPKDREVYSTEILVTSTLTKYSPKKLRFFVWMK